MKILPGLLVLVAQPLALSSAVPAAETIAGPVEALVVEVLDGDTFRADARVWPGQIVQVAVRIRGIDAPETRSRCDAERDAGMAARRMLEALVATRIVSISNVGGGKYYGRVLADVRTGEGIEIADFMIAQGLVRRYDGGRRESLC